VAGAWLVGFYSRFGSDVSKIRALVCYEYSTKVDVIVKYVFAKDNLSFLERRDTDWLYARFTPFKHSFACLKREALQLKRYFDHTVHSCVYEY
jgi:hypothetical protein